MVQQFWYQVGAIAVTMILQVWLTHYITPQWLCSRIKCVWRHIRNGSEMGCSVVVSAVAAEMHAKATQAVHLRWMAYKLALSRGEWVAVTLNIREFIQTSHYSANGSIQCLFEYYRKYLYDGISYRLILLIVSHTWYWTLRNNYC